jgi:hypothetical protein
LFDLVTACDFKEQTSKKLCARAAKSANGCIRTPAPNNFRQGISMNDSVYPLMYERPGPLVHWPPFRDLYQRGVRLFHVDATPSEDIYHPELRAWIASDTFDYSQSMQEYFRRWLREHYDTDAML